MIAVFGWDREHVRTIGGWQGFLQQEKGWVPGRKTYFFFDEAQLSYEDAELWGGFFKELVNFPDRFAIAFASYGSPSSRILIRGTPVFVSDLQRVSLRPIDHSVASVLLDSFSTEWSSMTSFVNDCPHRSITSILHSSMSSFISPEGMWEQSLTL
jgi:hypothetical protein